MIGRIISHYKIVDKLGEGGMGIVYLAEDMKLGRQVALKVLTGTTGSFGGARERFKREAKAAAALNHPNIVTVHEIDEHGDLVYIVMEYLEGQTLDKKLNINDGDVGFEKTTPLKSLKISEIVRYVIEICKGLKEAHQAGIVHRDIKLENILITWDERVKILDFGLAKLKGAGKLTGDSVVVGTSFYMSPEQLKGEEFDHRIDIWALGVLMYTMVAGDYPFRGDTTMEIVYAIMRKKPKAVAKINHDVPPALVTVIERCLQKDPGKRFQQIAHLQAALEMVLEALAAGKSTSRISTALWINKFRSHRVAVGLILAGLVLAFAALLLAPRIGTRVKKLLHLPIVPNQKKLVIFPLTIKDDEILDHQTFATGLTFDLTQKISRLERFHPDLVVVPFARVRKKRVTTPVQAWRNFGSNVTLQGSLSWQGEQIVLDLELFDKKEGMRLYAREVVGSKPGLIEFRNDLVKEAIDMLEIKLTPPKYNTVKIGCTEVAGVYRAYLQGLGNLYHPPLAEHIDHAIDLFTQAIKADSNYGLAYVALGEACYLKYHYSHEDRWREEALEYGRRAAATNTPPTDAYLLLAKIHQDRRQYEEALGYYRRALEAGAVGALVFNGTAEIYDALGQVEQEKEAVLLAVAKRPLDFTSFMDLGYFYYRHGQPEQSIRAFQAAAELNPDYYNIFNNLGGLYFYLERRKEAREMFERSLLLKPENNGNAYSNLGTLYFYEALYGDAVTMFSRALKLDPGNHKTWGYLAESYYWMMPRQEDKVRSSYEEAVRLATKELQESSVVDTDTLSLLSFYYERLGKRTEAEAFLEKVKKTKNLLPGVMLNLANTYEIMGRRKEALKWLEAALDGGVTLAEVENNPILADLRATPQYSELRGKTRSSSGARKEGRGTENNERQKPTGGSGSQRH